MDQPSAAKPATDYETELKAANEAVYKRSLELAKLTKALEEANTRQEGLIHFISHEVKGMLTKDMATFAALCEGDYGELTPKVKELVVAALAQTRDGVASVTDILTASNQKKGTIDYKKAPFDLAAAAQKIAETEKSIAEKKGLTFAYSTDEGGAPYTLNGDEKEIADHVFKNLIDNAINYTLSGSVGVSLKKSGDKFVFAVKDSGIGISDEDKQRLFTEGGHGKESQKVNVHSTGYGLFIAKNIVDAHGGTIRAESEGPGKGSTFVVELPIS